VVAWGKLGLKRLALVRPCARESKTHTAKSLMQPEQHSHPECRETDSGGNKADIRSLNP
jgi:hypothetical protein